MAGRPDGNLGVARIGGEGPDPVAEVDGGAEAGRGAVVVFVLVCHVAVVVLVHVDVAVTVAAVVCPERPDLDRLESKLKKIVFFVREY